MILNNTTSYFENNCDEIDTSSNRMVSSPLFNHLPYNSDSLSYYYYKSIDANLYPSNSHTIFPVNENYKDDPFSTSIIRDNFDPNDWFSTGSYNDCTNEHHYLENLNFSNSLLNKNKLNCDTHSEYMPLNPEDNNASHLICIPIESEDVCCSQKSEGSKNPSKFSVSIFENSEDHVSQAYSSPTCSGVFHDDYSLKLYSKHEYFNDDIEPLFYIENIPSPCNNSEKHLTANSMSNCSVNPEIPSPSFSKSVIETQVDPVSSCFSNVKSVLIETQVDPVPMISSQMRLRPRSTLTPPLHRSFSFDFSSPSNGSNFHSDSENNNDYCTGADINSFNTVINDINSGNSQVNTNTGNINHSLCIYNTNINNTTITTSSQGNNIDIRGKDTTTTFHTQNEINTSSDTIAMGKTEKPKSVVRQVLASKRSRVGGRFVSNPKRKKNKLYHE